MPKRIRTSNSELTKFLNSLPKQGFEITQPRSGHYHVNLDGRQIVIVGASPTDAHNVIKRTRKRIYERTGRKLDG
jgi:hypothetical protein